MNSQDPTQQADPSAVRLTAESVLEHAYGELSDAQLAGLVNLLRKVQTGSIEVGYANEEERAATVGASETLLFMLVPDSPDH